MLAGLSVECLRGELFVGEEEDVELEGEKGIGGGVAGCGYGGEVVVAKGFGEGWDPAGVVDWDQCPRLEGVERCEGRVLRYFCSPTRPSFFLNPCTNAGMASMAEELREGDALIVVRVVMSYSAHWM